MIITVLFRSTTLTLSKIKVQDLFFFIFFHVSCANMQFVVEVMYCKLVKYKIVFFCRWYTARLVAIFLLSIAHDIMSTTLLQSFTTSATLVHTLL